VDVRYINHQGTDIFNINNNSKIEILGNINSMGVLMEQTTIWLLF
jgi:hypothetical protein